MATNRKTPLGVNNRVGLWAALRDIFVTAINKGQLPIALVGLILVILIAKLTPTAAEKLLTGIGTSFLIWNQLGWWLFAAALVGWYFNARHLRRIHTQRIREISEEKKGLQEKLIGKKLPSSN